MPALNPFMEPTRIAMELEQTTKISISAIFVLKFIEIKIKKKKIKKTQKDLVK